MELGPEGLPEELIEDVSVESLHKAVCSWCYHLCSPVADIVEFQEYLVGMNHGFPAVFPAVVRENVLDFELMFFVEGQDFVIENISSGFREL